MTSKSLRTYRRPPVVATLLVASTLLLAMVALGNPHGKAVRKARSANSGTSARWNVAASKELEAQYHKLHDAWNALDVTGLKRMIIGDDVLATFDLDPDTHTPIKLTSKADIDKFTDKIFQDFKQSNIKTLAEHPLITCRATDGMGVCTEECKIQLLQPTGEKQVLQLRATAVAVRDQDGWKFIQWHMSEAGPILNFDKQGREVAATNSKQ